MHISMAHHHSEDGFTNLCIMKIRYHRCDS